MTHSFIFFSLQCISLTPENKAGLPISFQMSALHRDQDPGHDRPPVSPITHREERNTEGTLTQLRGKEVSVESMGPTESQLLFYQQFT